MAQLVAHLLCKQRVAGSSPASSTTTTVNGEETCFFISESEEVVRNTECCWHGEPERYENRSGFRISEGEETVRNPVRDYWH